ncbi:PAS domain-containing protein [Lamprocystis purpurea]|uniref:PAS domain-containing protein n=1 Tax=Lamprocystis purpurea TaxID=61598 RepID=UPI00037AA901|nr:PAS domain-containing protein [Lamprocystis purpurea]
MTTDQTAAPAQMGDLQPTSAPRGLYRHLLTAALALAAIAGNHFNLALPFGVDFLFGSIAVLVALAYLGTGPGLVAALAGGAYTWLLWGQPYALILFTAEAAAVGWHQGWMRKRGHTPPPLAVSVTLYWLLLGIPLALLCHRFGLGMDWSTTLLIAVKQALNGILNATLAGLILVAIALLTGQRSALPLARVLFGALLAGMLLPTVLVSAWDNRELREILEAAQAERLLLFGELAAHQLMINADGATDPVTIAREFYGIDATLPATAAPTARLERGAASPPPPPPHGWLADRPRPGQTIPTSAPGLELILPEGRYPSHLKRWRQARYRMEISDDTAPVLLDHTLPPGWRLVVAISATPLIDQLQAWLARLLLLLLVLALLGVVLAFWLSRRLVTPLHRLARYARALPLAIREDQPRPPPVPALLAETGELADAVADMADSLAASFRALREEHDARRMLHEALSRQEARFRFLFEAMAEGVIGEGADGAVAEANPAALRLLGLSLAQLQGRDPIDPRWQAVREDGLPIPTAGHPPLAALRSSHDQGETVMGILEPRSGALRWLLVHSHPQPGAPPADPPRLFATLADITRQKQTEHRLRTLIENAPHGIVETDPTSRRLRWCSGSMRRLFGYSAAELDALHLDDLHPADARDRVLSEFNRMIEGDLAPALDLPCRRRDGSVFYCKVSPILTRLGPEWAFMLFFTDATAEYQARRALEQAHEALLKAQDLARLGSWELDLATGRIAWSPEVFRIFELAPERFGASYETVLAAIHPDDRDMVDRAYQDSLANRTPYDLVHRLRMPDGRIKWLRERCESEFAADGTPLRSRGTVQDISDHTAAELALRAQDQRQRLADLIAGTRVGTWEWQIQTGVTVFNARWAEIIGYRLAELAPTTFQTWIDLTHPDDIERCKNLLQKHFSGELETYECAARMRHKNGHWVWILYQGRVVQRDGAGAPLLMSGTHQDINARKVAELALLQRNAMLDELLVLTAGFATPPDQDIDRLTAPTLARLGRFNQADHACLLRLAPATGTLTTALEWTADSQAPGPWQHQARTSAGLPALVARLRAGETVMIPRVADLPTDWSGEREHFSARGIQSVLLVPLGTGDTLRGALALDCVRDTRDWSAAEVNLLQIVANLLNSRGVRLGARVPGRTNEE